MAENDVVETALALGITEAAKALARGDSGALVTLTALAAELTARREARAGVVVLDLQRTKRGRS